MDYEKLPFKCRWCHEYEHFFCNCPKKQEDQQEKEDGWKPTKKSKTKAKSGEMQRKEWGKNDHSKASPKDKANEK